MAHREHFSPGGLLTVVVALTVGPLLVVGCRRDGPAEPTEFRITVVAGNGQTGQLGTRLSLDLAVRVTDRNGRGRPNVPLNWRVISGAGDLLNLPDGAPFTVTDASGLAAVSLRPTVLGPIIVTASAATAPGASATFNAFVKSVPGAVIRIVPGFDCEAASTFIGPTDRRTSRFRWGQSWSGSSMLHR
jgi:hypothetical protein